MAERREGFPAAFGRLPAVGLLLAAALGHPAFAETSGDRYRLITSERPATLERKLQAAAAGGFHLIAAARGTSLSGKGRGVVLLERSAAGQPPAEYALVTTSGDLAAVADDTRLRSLAAEGYRLEMRHVLPDSPDDWWVAPSGYESQVWLILERRDPGAAFAYDAFGYESPQAFAREMSARTAGGYDALGVLNSARRLRVLLERDLGRDGRSDETRVAPGGRYRMLIGSRKLGLRLQLNDAADDGYRLAGIADASTIAPPMMLVEKRADRIENHIYRTLYEPGVKIFKDKLERKLNKRARKGLRIVPGGITATVVVFETSPRPVEYRTLSSAGRPGLTEQLARASDDGFALVAMFVNGDETTLVVERDVRD